ncbi:MAG TPA: glucose-6-phosphate dehydrogenase [Blastocatellia bacterium]|nr:glucose-6-phosphate dehydrogenase [Blastocatellia bacterium]
MTRPQPPNAQSDDNPLREGVRLEKAAEPCAVVIFGASGDLTKRKLVPALYRLTQERLLPAEFAILGFARSPMSDDEFRNRMKDAVLTFSDAHEVDDAVWESFANGLFYVAGDVNEPAAYSKLKEVLQRVDRERGTSGNRVFYLSTSPALYSEAIQQLGASGLAQPEGQGWTRVIIEKPFGHDLQSAKQLNEEVAQVFSEDQVYRIDHYLGKETVQNLLVFRFANGIFEPIWNRRYIDHVQLTNAESIGVEGRGGYYDTAGVIRDMIQNHVFQVLSLVALEPPVNLGANAVRDEKIKAMQAVRMIPSEHVDEFVVRGQYGPGFIEGKRVPGYLEERDVKANSQTETFAALKLFFDNWRWAGVPFYLRSGKRMPKRVTEIAIHFRPAPLPLFKTVTEGQTMEPNVLVVRIQPDEGITLRVGAKVPGQVTRIRWVNMDFRYGSSFGISSPEAYERLLLDCILGDSTLYARRDMTERGWEIVMPILEAWSHSKAEIPNYESGSWGPKEAHELIERDGRRWRRL